MESQVLKTIQSYFLDVSLTTHKLKSYNEIPNLFAQLIRETPPWIVRQEISEHETKITTIYLKSAFFDKPQYTEADGSITYLTPNMCRLRNLTYTCPLYLTCEKQITLEQKGKREKGIIYQETEDIEEKFLSSSLDTVVLGHIPVLLFSDLCVLNKNNLREMGECEYDPFGYYIVNGSEKVIIGQERMNNNQIYIFPNKDDKIVAEIRSIEENSKRSPSLLTVSAIYSTKNGNIILIATLPFMKKIVPLGILLKALGLESNSKIKEMIADHHLHYNRTMDMTLEHSYYVTTQKEALKWMGDNAIENKTNLSKSENLLNMLQKDMLPHIGTDSKTLTDKYKFIGFMAYRVLEILHESDLSKTSQLYDERDNYKNKRIDYDVILFDILKSSFQRAYSECQKILSTKNKNNQAHKEINIANIIESKYITNDLKYCLATGNWGANKKITKTGVSQVLNRLNYTAVISHLRRLTTTISKEGASSKVRQLHNSHYGMICPSETPEGGMCGINKNLATLCHISSECSNSVVIPIIHQIIKKTSNQIFDMYNFDNKKSKIFLKGGLFICSCQDTSLFIREFKKFKYLGFLPFDVSITLKYNDIYIYNDAGRTCRPLFVVKNHQLLIGDSDVTSWQNLIDQGYIEYLDCAEQELSLIALHHDSLKNENYTHCEIHNSFMFGPSAGLIPYANYNQTPRNCYASGMNKQTKGIYAMNFNNRFDTASHILMYPQKRLVSTQIHREVKQDELPQGVNCIVAIMNYLDNQEDGIIVNKSAIDRGLFRSFTFRTYKDQETKTSSSEELFGKLSHHKYHKIDEDGLPTPGMYLKTEEGELKGDIVIGKTLNQIEKDASLLLKNINLNSVTTKFGEKGIVDSVMLSTIKNSINNESKIAKVRVRELRIPEVGDKLSSTHSQKGTIGAIIPSYDLPFTQDGIVPDLIINSSAIPSRCTIGHIMEMLSGKESCVAGKFVDATPFNKLTDLQKSEALKKYGLSPLGKESMYSGTTGKPINALIFTGVPYYHRLKHMVADKIHVRARGRKIPNLSRQPPEGRSKNGGLKIGVMETDLLVAHAGVCTLREKLMLLSDRYKAFFCGDCGLLATANRETKNYYCKNCPETKNICQIEIPYACKLMFQELASLNLACRISF